MRHQTKIDIPYIDPNVQYVGVSKLRQLNASNLLSLEKTLVIQDNDKPLAVMISFEQFIEIQQDRERILATLNLLFDKEELLKLSASVDDLANNRTQSLSEVRENLKRGNE